MLNPREEGVGVETSKVEAIGGDPPGGGLQISS